MALRLVPKAEHVFRKPSAPAHVVAERAYRQALDRQFRGDPAVNAALVGRLRWAWCQELSALVDARAGERKVWERGPDPHWRLTPWQQAME
jgi:hypothetical protein